MRDLFSDDHIREWAFEEAETAFSHLLESPAKDKIAKLRKDERFV